MSRRVRYDMAAATIARLGDDETARLCGVSPASVSRWRYEGWMPAHRYEALRDAERALAAQPDLAPLPVPLGPPEPPALTIHLRCRPGLGDGRFTAALVHATPQGAAEVEIPGAAEIARLVDASRRSPPQRPTAPTGCPAHA